MTENEIQRAVFAHLRQRGMPGVFAFHPRNEGLDQRKRFRRGINSGLGVVSGVPDVIIVHNGKTFGLELKAAKGRKSDEQIKTQIAMQAAGATVATATGLDEALMVLEFWGVLKGKAA